MGVAWAGNATSTTVCMVGYYNSIYDDEATSTSTGVIIISEDFGLNWSSKETLINTNEFYDVAGMMIAEVGYFIAVGGLLHPVISNYGSIAYSTNSGRSWSTNVFLDSSSSHINSLNGVSLGSNGNAFACSYMGEIYSSNTSDLTHWTTTLNPIYSGGQLLAISTADGINVITVGESGAIYYSTNSGIDWTLSTSVPPVTSVDLFCVSVASSTLAVAGGNSGVVIMSTDGGISWTSIAAPSTFAAYPNFNGHVLSVTLENGIGKVIIAGSSSSGTTTSAIFENVNVSSTSWSMDQTFSTQLKSLSSVYSSSMVQTFAAAGSTAASGQLIYTMVNGK